MDLIDRSLTDLTAFAVRRGISEATLGNRAVGDATFLTRLREGRVTIAVLERALAYIAEQDNQAGKTGEAA
jgi:hypothetical protein